jgi:hypothetical protein
VLDRLTNPKAFTGAHKQRFDESGKVPPHAMHTAMLYIHACYPHAHGMQPR